MCTDLRELASLQPKISLELPDLHTCQADVPALELSCTPGAHQPVLAVHTLLPPAASSPASLLRGLTRAHLQRDKHGAEHNHPSFTSAHGGPTTPTPPATVHELAQPHIFANCSHAGNYHPYCSCDAYEVPRKEHMCLKPGQGIIFAFQHRLNLNSDLEQASQNANPPVATPSHVRAPNLPCHPLQPTAD